MCLSIKKCLKVTISYVLLFIGVALAFISVRIVLKESQRNNGLLEITGLWYLRCLEGKSLLLNNISVFFIQ